MRCDIMSMIVSGRSKRKGKGTNRKWDMFDCTRLLPRSHLRLKSITTTPTTTATSKIGIQIPP